MASFSRLDVKAGDRVLFGKWSGTEVKLDGEDLIIMKESDVMGIIGPVGCPQGRVGEHKMAAKDVKFSADAREADAARRSTFSPMRSR